MLLDDAPPRRIGRARLRYGDAAEKWGTQPVVVEGLRWGRIAVLLLFRILRRVSARFLAADGARCVPGATKRACKRAAFACVISRQYTGRTGLPCRVVSCVIDSGRSVKIYPSSFSSPPSRPPRAYGERDIKISSPRIKSRRPTISSSSGWSSSRDTRRRETCMLRASAEVRTCIHDNVSALCFLPLTTSLNLDTKRRVILRLLMINGETQDTRRRSATCIILYHY